MRETNPNHLSGLLSDAYSDFTPDFREIWMDRAIFPIADSGSRRRRQTNPNKPKGLKTFGISYISEECEKQTQRAYRSCYQSFTAVLPAIFENSGWIERPPDCRFERLLRRRQTNPNKPNRTKTLTINDISGKRDKQTQATYQPYPQSLTASFAPIFEKFGWAARPSRSPTLNSGRRWTGASENEQGQDWVHRLTRRWNLETHPKPSTEEDPQILRRSLVI
jgi:hypothetical protein